MLTQHKLVVMGIVGAWLEVHTDQYSSTTNREQVNNLQEEGGTETLEGQILPASPFPHQEETEGQGVVPLEQKEEE